MVSYDVPNEDDSPITNRSLRVLRGKVLIEINDENIGLSDETLIAIINEVFKRIENNATEASID